MSDSADRQASIPSGEGATADRGGAGGQVIRLAGEMTIYRAAALREKLLAQMDALSTIDLDLSGVVEMDTAGLQLLLAAKKEAQRSHKPFRVIAPSEGVRALLELYALAPADIHLEQAP